MNKEGKIKNLNFMTLKLGIVVLGCVHNVDIVKMLNFNKNLL